MKIIPLIVVTIGIYQQCLGQGTYKGWSGDNYCTMDRVKILVEQYDEFMMILSNKISKLMEQVAHQEEELNVLRTNTKEIQKDHQLETNMLNASVQKLEIWQKNFGEGIRLVHEQGMPSSDRYGRLEVFHCLSGTCEWGTVCDDGFDESNANVACRQLGYGTHSALKRDQTNTEFPGTGEIWLDDVVCKGSESSLYECGHGGWGVENCDHDEDIIIGCN